MTQLGSCLGLQAGTAKPNPSVGLAAGWGCPLLIFSLSSLKREAESCPQPAEPPSYLTRASIQLQRDAQEGESQPWPWRCCQQRILSPCRNFLRNTDFSQNGIRAVKELPRKGQLGAGGSGEGEALGLACWNVILGFLFQQKRRPRRRHHCLIQL